MKKKIILILVIIAIVVGGIVMFAGSSSNNEPSGNTNTNTNTNNNQNESGGNKENTNLNKGVDKKAKETYDAILKKMNTEIEYFVSEYDMAGNLAEYEMFKMPEHVVSVGRMIDGIDGFVFGLNFSYKDTTYALAVDEDGTMVYEEAKSEEVYSKDMYSDFFANPLADVVTMTQSEKDGKIILTIHAVLDYEGTDQYLIYNMTVNKDYLIEQEEMIVANEKFEFEEGADSAIVKFHSYNAKKAEDFKQLLEKAKTAQGLTYEQATDILKR